MQNILLLHGGVGIDNSMVDSANKKLNSIAGSVKLGSDPLDAAVNAVVIMENDPDFNAGTGSVMRIDGSIQMDASVAIPGRFGSVLAIESVKNPVLVARDVMELTPHTMLAGDGAVKFARLLGFKEYDPSTDKARNRLKTALNSINDPNGESYSKYSKLMKKTDFSRFLSDSCDTVGSVARIDGRFAAAVSTGGASPMLRGRIGDSPIFGAGIYVGEKGAVVATGIGEDISRRLLCFRIHEKIGTKPLQKIMEEEIGFFKDVIAGVIAVSANEHGYFANKDMGIGLKLEKQL
jgi:isoaspartyl peptidase/L-asparaginase-like protein (Ntn-hydrolase superfamily)